MAKDMGDYRYLDRSTFPASMQESIGSDFDYTSQLGQYAPKEGTLRYALEGASMTPNPIVAVPASAALTVNDVLDMIDKGEVDWPLAAADAIGLAGSVAGIGSARKAGKLLGEEKAIQHELATGPKFGTPARRAEFTKQSDIENHVNDLVRKANMPIAPFTDKAGKVWPAASTLPQREELVAGLTDLYSKKPEAMWRDLSKKWDAITPQEAAGRYADDLLSGKSMLDRDASLVWAKENSPAALNKLKALQEYEPLATQHWKDGLGRGLKDIQGAMPRYPVGKDVAAAVARGVPIETRESR